ncbi:glucose-6-phosphate dehydrogenase [Lapidilactobacillus gannanensis]|uniref:Glucose-6-phosphate 1-dehydrogenase n=1 Tax=Lapidilactobacillus gannanensis TaxID=2486002 RepID=A0ABW4BKU7_9LACO|nr:glucose-6-phosphate dehydrogenase [Lapidilactobacillus gannanensis]
MKEENPVLFVIFGGSGDLAHRKLYPALFQLFQKGQLDQHFAVIGTARRPWTHEYFRETVQSNLHEGTAEQQAAFAAHFYYQSHDVQDAAHYVILKKLIDTLDQKYQLQGNRIFYMAMAPALFGTIAQYLRSEDLLSHDGFSRLIIEKPFGHDYASAKELNDAIVSTFDRDQVFRIDHYLGKEMVQALPYLRFANQMINASWNHEYIDNVQITLAESLGVEERGGYYETAGALRDMVQNHIMQVIAMLTFPEPETLCDQTIEAAREQVFTHLHQLSEDEVKAKFVRGQYGPSADGQQIGYRQEEKINPQSNVETFVAGELELDLPQWQGVPFYVRTGKRLLEKKTRIDIVFKKATSNLFGGESLAAPVLTIEVEPESGFIFSINGKQVGTGTQAVLHSLKYQLTDADQQLVPDAYERLLLEVVRGHQSNFVQWQDMAGAWHFVDKIRQAWEECDCPDFPNYTSGSMGPKAADDLLAKTGRHWIYQG